MKSARWICGVLALGVALTACDQTPGNDTENKRLTQDSLALVALFNATHGPNWTDNTNWLTASVDSWFGVTIEGDRVTALNLGNNQLDGPIPPELGNLTRLKVLQLGFNELTGAVPPQLGQLTGLERLLLHDNPLSGSLPLRLTSLTNLMFFNFEHTDLCEPSDSTFQRWLQRIDNVTSTGVTCAAPSRSLDQ